MQLCWTRWIPVVFTVALLLLVAPLPASAQSVPAGVGDAASVPVWLEADQLSLSDGEPVSTWPNRAPSEVSDAEAQGGTPTFQEAAVNGHAAVQFEGGGSRVAIPDEASLQSDQVTVFSVAVPSTIGGTSRLVAGKWNPGGNGAYRLSVREVTTGGFFGGRTENGLAFGINGQEAAGTQTQQGTPQLLSGFYNGSTLGALVGGGSVASQPYSQPINQSGQPFTVGARPDGSRAFEGQIAETIVYTEALNSAEQRVIEVYLASKYGLGSIPKYTYWQGHGTSFTGVAQREEATILTSRSGMLQLEAPSGGDSYGIYFGHDGRDGYSFGYEETQQVGSYSPSEVLRVERKWRFGFKGRRGGVQCILNDCAITSKNVTFSIQEDSLESIPTPSASYEYALIVADAADFSSGVQINSLQKENGRYKTSLTLEEGDYVTIGAIQDGSSTGSNIAGGRVVWLRAKDLSVSDGNIISSWSDASGSGNDAEVSTGAPTLKTDQFNGEPAVQFDGSSALTISDKAMLDNGSGVTIFAVVRPDGTGKRSILSKQEQRQGLFGTRTVTSYIAHIGSGGNATLGVSGFDLLGPSGTVEVTSSATVGNGQATIVQAWFDEGDDSGGVRINGETTTGLGQGRRSVADTDAPLKIGGSFQGEIAELMIYNEELSEAERTVIRSNLASKYFDSQSGGGQKDYYAGDAPENGGYGLDVIGVLNVGGTTISQAEGGGLTIDASQGLDETNDRLFAGHRVPKDSNIVVSDNVSQTGALSSDPAPGRSKRVWYLDVENNGGNPVTVDLTFNMSAMGLGAVSGKAENYRLLYRQDTTDAWSDAGLSASIEGGGDKLRFTGVQPNQDGYYTIATRHVHRSPLDPSVLVLHGTPGTGSYQQATYGDDAGWRSLGVPVTGATYADIRSDSDPRVLENLSPPIVYKWRDGWKNVDAEGQDADPIVNGRGFMFYIIDDSGAQDADPLDPDMSLWMRAGEAPGNTDVTVGDQKAIDGSTLSADQPLKKKTRYHFLANPYARPYDLSDLPLVKNGFQSTVQVWKPSGSDSGSTTGTWEIVSTGPVLCGTLELNCRLAPWQGFLIQRTLKGIGSNTLTFEKEGRIEGGSSFIGLTRKASEKSGPVAHLGFSLKSSGDNPTTYDSAISLLFTPRADSTWDGFDATKRKAMSSTFATVAPVGLGPDSTLQAKARESLPYQIEGPKTIPFTFDQQNAPSTLQLEAENWQGVPSDWSVTLIDTKGTTDTSDDQAVPFGPDESFTFDVSEPKSSANGTTQSGKEARGRPNPLDTDYARRLVENARPKSSAKKKGSPPRFRLRIEPSSGTLPVELSKFKAQRDGRDVLLEWRTASEQNNATFVVQKKKADSTFKGIGDIPGSGTTSSPKQYRYRAKDLNYGQHTFRLKQVDTDGDVHYSDAIRTEVNLQSEYDVSEPYPNPASQSTSINVTVRSGQEITGVLYDMLGRRVKTVKREQIPSNQTERLVVETSDLSSGTYFFRVKGKDFKTTRRVVVMH